jgi:hypothetical protein
VSGPEHVRVVGNLASTLVGLGDLPRGATLHAEGLQLAQELGLVEPIRWLTMERAIDLEMAGDWEEARRLVDDLIPEFETSPFWIEPMTRTCRARMLLAQGAVGEARADAERAREPARSSTDFQAVSGPLAFLARLRVELEENGGPELVDEVLDRWIESSSGYTDEWVIDLWFAAWRTGREERMADRLASVAANPWLDAVAALIRREFGVAAATLEAMGAAFAAALVRLWAAEWLVEQRRRAEADRELERSLAFWRSVGATRYVRQGEALLAESA